MSVLDLTTAKDHLNITGDAYDVKVQAALDAAEAAIARKVGPLTATAVTSRVSGRSSALVLPTVPVVSVTSVTGSDSSTISVADLVTDPAGVVEYATCGSFPAAAYTVVYQAGRASLPADLEMAVLELLRHLWTTQRGGGTRPGSTPSEGLSNTLPGAAFTFPIRVEQLIEAYVPLGGA